MSGIILTTRNDQYAFDIAVGVRSDTVVGDEGLASVLQDLSCSIGYYQRKGPPPNPKSVNG